MRKHSASAQGSPVSGNLGGALSIFDSLIESALAAVNYGIARNGTAKLILTKCKQAEPEAVSQNE
jgi:hypothetical protein